MQVINTLIKGKLHTYAILEEGELPDPNHATCDHCGTRGDIVLTSNREEEEGTVFDCLACGDQSDWVWYMPLSTAPGIVLYVDEYNAEIHENEAAYG